MLTWLGFFRVCGHNYKHSGKFIVIFFFRSRIFIRRISEFDAIKTLHKMYSKPEKCFREDERFSAEVDV